MSRNPFKEIMNEDIQRFDASHSEGIKESIERKLSTVALFTNPFKVLSQASPTLSEAKEEAIKLGIQRRLSSSAALGNAVSSYLDVCVRSFFTFNATVLDGVTEQLRLTKGKSIAAISVKIYELMAAQRMTLGKQVADWQIDGIFKAYRPIQFTFALPLSEVYVKERVPQALATLFQQIDATEFRLLKVQKVAAGFALTVELPENNGAYLMHTYNATDFADLYVENIQVVENPVQELFPIPFEKEAKQLIADIEALLDLGKLEEALNNFVDFLFSHRLQRPQSQAFKLQGSYAYINNNRAHLSAAAIAAEEDGITRAFRALLSSL